MPERKILATAQYNAYKLLHDEAAYLNVFCVQQRTFNMLVTTAHSRGPCNIIAFKHSFYSNFRKKLSEGVAEEEQFNTAPNAAKLLLISRVQYAVANSILV